MAGYQLTLQIKLNDAATFENFLPGDNAEVLKILRATNEPYVFLWSAEAAGKTHLLQSLCHIQAPGQAIYLPLCELSGQSAAILEGLEQFDLVCLDDVHCIAGNADWETALFHLYNRLRDRSGRLCVSSTKPPTQLMLNLADLTSRLSWGPVFQIQALDDDDKVKAMQLRARQRGFDLPQEVANYLLNRYPRDLHSLFALLDKLDLASLQAQRRLTIPFVKQWLSLSSE